MARKTKTYTFFELLTHRWLRIPFILHATDVKPAGKPRATIVLIHGLGNSGDTWKELLPLVPKDIRVISIDLLGFGRSPVPPWVRYNAKTHARSVARTLLRLKLTQAPVLVGHSLGALVAVEVTRRYSFAVRRLILCSPPFYALSDETKGLINRDKILKDIYKAALKHPRDLQRLLPFAARLGFANKSINVAEDHIGSYVATLETSIINQTSLRDIKKLKLPITVFYGAFDPLVIGSHIQGLAKEKSNITAKRLLAGHEIVGAYTKSLAEEITDSI